MKKTFPLSLAALILTLLFALPADERDGLWPLERLLQDWQTQHTLQNHVDGRIIIVDIDDRALQTVGRWPWDRATIARLLHILSEEGQAAEVGVDLLFPETSPEDAKLLPLTARNIIFAQSFGTEPHPPAGVPGTGARLNGIDPPAAMQVQSLVGMTPDLAQHAKVAHITPTFDADGKIRHIQPLLIYQGQAYETLALAMLRDFFDLPAEYTLQRNTNPLASAYKLRDSTQTLQLPLDDQGRLRLPFTTPTQGFLHISAADVLQGNFPPDLFADRLVLVGSSAAGLGDLVPTPVAPTHPAVQIHAILLQALLDRHFIVQPQGATFILAAILLVLALVLAILLPRTSPLLGLSIIVLFAALWVGLNHLAWRHGLALPISPVLAWLAILLLLHGLIALQTARGEKRRLIRQLKAYLPHEIARQVARHGDPFKPERRLLTVMFVDLRDFTALAEGMAPEALAALMDRYLSLVTRHIHSHGGTLDKYMGDGVMAFWGAPLPNPAHAQAAFQAALDIACGIEQLSRTLASEGLPPLRVGIGLHTGMATVGQLGTRFRHTYTALGDTVNTASRIEGLTRDLNQTILLSRETAQQLPPTTPLQDLGLQPIRGRREPVHLFAPAQAAQPCAAASPSTPSQPLQRPAALLQACILLLGGTLSLPLTAQGEETSPDTLYQQALIALRTGKTAQAIEQLEQLIRLQPNHAGAYLDLALAYQSLGQSKQALHLLDQLLERFDPPPTLRQLIEQQRQALISLLYGTQPPRTQWQIEQALGYASNINAGPRTHEILIDLGFGPLQWRLAESSLPQADHYAETRLGLQHNLPWRGLKLEWSALAELRRHAHISTYDTDFFHTSIGLERPADPIGWELGLALHHLRLGHAPYQQGATLALGLPWHLSQTTLLHPQLQTVMERYPEDTVYDAQLWRARLDADWAPTPTWNLGLSLGWETDRARNQRAGGDREGLTARLAAAYRPSPDDQLELAARITEKKDQAPYNPLLFGDTHRLIRRRDLTAMYSHRLHDKLWLSLEISAQRDTANIDLFTLDNWQAELRLTWQP